MPLLFLPLSVFSLPRRFLIFLCAATDNRDHLVSTKSTMAMGRSVGWHQGMYNHEDHLQHWQDYPHAHLCALRYSRNRRRPLKAYSTADCGIGSLGASSLSAKSVSLLLELLIPPVHICIYLLTIALWREQHVIDHKPISPFQTSFPFRKAFSEFTASPSVSSS